MAKITKSLLNAYASNRRSITDRISEVAKILKEIDPDSYKVVHGKWIIEEDRGLVWVIENPCDESINTCFPLKYLFVENGSIVRAEKRKQRNFIKEQAKLAVHAVELDKAIKLSKFPIPNFSVVEELIYYDGPVLVHCISTDNHNYLASWVDDTSLGYRWLFFQVNYADLLEFLHGRESLLSLILDCPSGFAFITDIERGAYTNTKMLQIKDIPIEYLPESESFFHLNIPEKYTTNSHE